MHDLIEKYIGLGLSPLPLAPKSKLPTHKAWNKLLINNQNYKKYFYKDSNVGVILDGSIVDIDLDCATARKLGLIFLPKTKAVFGRKTAPRSHYLYRTSTTNIKKLKYIKYAVNDKGQENCYCELRYSNKKHALTMPPSIHPNGEVIKWYVFEDITYYENIDLIQRAVLKIALGCFVINNWGIGFRQDATIAIAGALLKSGWSGVEVLDFLKIVVEEAEGTLENTREAGIIQTIEKFKNNQAVSGIPAIKEIFGNDKGQVIEKWLGKQIIVQNNDLGIIENQDGLFFVKTNAKKEQILHQLTTFTIKPTQSIIHEIDGETIEANIEVRNRKYKVQIPPHVWNSASNFRKFVTTKIPRYGACFVNDNQVQLIRAYISKYEIEEKKGVEKAGFHKDYFVTHEGSLTLKGKTKDIVYLDSNQCETSLIDQQGISKAELMGIKKLLGKFNEKKVVQTVLGWTVACFWKDKIMEKYKGFPLLYLEGKAGSGKSRTAEDIIQRIWAIENKPRSITGQTKFSMLKLVSNTNCIPLIFEEYKPLKMSVQANNIVSDLFRNSYNGFKADRGKKDLTLVQYEYSAPVCITSETSIDEPAVLDRTVGVLLSKEISKEYKSEYEELQNLALEKLGNAILQYRLQYPAEMLYHIAKYEKTQGLIDKKLQNRARLNTAVIMAGVDMLNKVLGEKIIDVDEIQNGMFEFVFDDDHAENYTTKSEVSKVLENMFEMASYEGPKETPIYKYQDALLKNVHYTIVDRQLRLHAKGGLLLYNKWCAMHKQEQTITLSTFWKQVKTENYFLERKVAKIGKKPQKAIILDIEILKKEGLEDWLLLT